MTDVTAEDQKEINKKLRVINAQKARRKNSFDRRTMTLRDDMMYLLKQHCEFMRISKTDIATRLGVSPQRVHKCFNDTPTVEYIIEMMIAAGMDVKVVCNKHTFKY